jgi:hypothetical protein
MIIFIVGRMVICDCDLLPNHGTLSIRNFMPLDPDFELLRFIGDQI